MRHWLMKTEPDVFAYDDLVRERRTGWDGVRNSMREIRRGDLVVYHSNAKPPRAAGIARVVGEAGPDLTQFDLASEYHDPRSPREAPRWDLVTLAPKRRLWFVPLKDLRALPALRDCPLLARGNRLSVLPLTPAEFAAPEAAGRSGTGCDVRGSIGVSPPAQVASRDAAGCQSRHCAKRPRPVPQRIRGAMPPSRRPTRRGAPFHWAAQHR
jgi:predicted RNA-binding protein with PUA-like domain